MTTYSRRQLVQGAGAVGLGLVAGCGRLPWQAEQQAKIPRVGLLAGTPPWAEVFRQALRELAYVEGQTVMIEYRPIDGQAERLPGFAAELIGLQVDAIVAVGTPAIRAAQEATDTIPIIMVSALDPVGEGFVASLAQPGRNITGVSLLAGQLTGKRLELLKEAVAGVSRVAGLWQPISLSQSQEAEGAARVLGVQLRLLEVQGAEDIERAFDVAAREHAEAVLVLSTPVTVTHATFIAELGMARGLPTMFDRREFAEAGGLMSYGPNQSDQFRRAAYYVDRILKGTKPADLPIEQPREFDFIVNLRTAQALGLTIPPHVLLQATEVLQ